MCKEGCRVGGERGVACVKRGVEWVGKEVWHV